MISSLGERRPRLLLHVCCAPGSTHCMDLLLGHFELVLDCYNPNIWPPEEYDKRLGELVRLTGEAPFAGRVELPDAPYDHSEFLDAARGLEDEPEGGARCAECFRLRLTHAARAARAAGAEYFTTTLTVSPHKDSQLLNRLGREIGRAEGVEFLCSDFKKRDGYRHSIELSAKYGLYRQNWCGCEFSLPAGNGEDNKTRIGGHGSEEL